MARTEWKKQAEPRIDNGMLCGLAQVLRREEIMDKTVTWTILCFRKIFWVEEWACIKKKMGGRG